MKKIIIVGAVLLSTITYSQTKLIAFKSHSGSLKNLEKALLDPKFDLVNHNLGNPPNMNLNLQPIELMPKVSELDSLIFISESQAVIVTSQFCSSPENVPEFAQDTLALPWSEGKDTLLYHPLFSKQHSLDSIKAILKSEYFFRNDIEKAVFIGYDNGEDSLQNSGSIPITEGDNEEVTPISQGNGGGLQIILLSLILAATCIGLISWMISRRTNKSQISA